MILTEDLSNFTANVLAADALFKAAEDNILQAEEDAASYETKSYGQVIDDSLKPMLIDFSSMLSSFTENVTDIGQLIHGLTGTVVSIQTFTTGFSLFNQSYNTAVAGAGGNGTLFFLLITDPIIILDPDTAPLPAD